MGKSPFRQTTGFGNIGSGNPAGAAPEEAPIIEDAINHDSSSLYSRLLGWSRVKMDQFSAVCTRFSYEAGYLKTRVFSVFQGWEKVKLGQLAGRCCEFARDISTHAKPQGSYELALAPVPVALPHRGAQRNLGGADIHHPNVGGGGI